MEPEHRRGVPGQARRRRTLLPAGPRSGLGRRDDGGPAFARARMRPPYWQPTCLCADPGSLGGGRVHLWFASLAAQRPWMEAYAAVLTPQESRQVSRLAGGVVRERFVVGRGMLRILLGSYLGLEPRAVEFRNPPGGKPTLAPSTCS